MISGHCYPEMGKGDNHVYMYYDHAGMRLNVSFFTIHGNPMFNMTPVDKVLRIKGTKQEWVTFRIAEEVRPTLVTPMDNKQA